MKPVLSVCLAVAGALVTSFAVPSSAVAATTTQTTQTTFVLAHPMPLSTIVGPLRAINATPVFFAHTTTSGQNGGNFSRGLILDQAVTEYRRNYHYMVGDGEPQIWQFTLEGSVPKASIGGELASEIVSVNQISTAPRNRPEPLANATPLQDAPRQFAPASGQTATADLGDRRRIDNSMTWADQQSIDSFGGFFAYEHDFKLVNPAGGANRRPNCLPGQLDNHWAKSSNVSFNTTFPADAGPYFDSANIFDSCANQDFTIGLYFPSRLTPQVEYITTVVTDAGNLNSEPYRLNAQKLENNCPPGEVPSPFCVGVIPLGEEGQLLVGGTQGMAPGCRLWVKGQESRPCPPTEPVSPVA